MLSGGSWLSTLPLPNALWWDNDAGGSSGGVAFAASATNIMVGGSGTASDGKLLAIHVIAKAELF